MKYKQYYTLQKKKKKTSYEEDINYEEDIQK